ncbi:helix-turn-helix domain-containing protein [Streptomyces sp. NPDC059900]|uniref:helix-turn-helix domain-containing protein n=1 Tax=Streptomyces sp. NPDC059900 TaxID=3155816 RepID=UPI0034427F46
MNAVFRSRGREQDGGLDDTTEMERPSSSADPAPTPDRFTSLRPKPSTVGDHDDAPSRRGAHMTRGGSNRLLTPEEVAVWLRVSPTTVRNKYRLWGLKPQKVGRLLRFRERDVLAYLDKHYG